MRMTEEVRINAPREEVFAALNNPDILRQSIPGCQALEQVSDTELIATVQAKVGPVRAKFNGTVKLSKITPPESYTISGEGKGGAAGFAKGLAHISLIVDGDVTVLRYEVNAEVGGKLAQVGSRLIDGASKKLAGEFFETFSNLLESAEKARTRLPPQKKALNSEIPPLLWVEIAVLGLILIASFTA